MKTPRDRALELLRPILGYTTSHSAALPGFDQAVDALAAAFTPPDPPKRIRDAVRPTGALVSMDTGNGFISWLPEYETAELDGEFTSEELRAIADHMESHR